MVVPPRGSPAVLFRQAAVISALTCKTGCVQYVKTSIQIFPVMP